MDAGRQSIRKIHYSFFSSGELKSWFNGNYLTGADNDHDGAISEIYCFNQMTSLRQNSRAERFFPFEEEFDRATLACYSTGTQFCDFARRTARGTEDLMAV